MGMTLQAGHYGSNKKFCSKRFTCGAVVFSGLTAVAHAQGNVTLYGVLDDAVAYSNNQRGSSNVYLLQGSLTSSRFGIKGSEPLNSTTKSIFQLEAGFDPNTGKQASAGIEFNRQAWVGLQDSKIGTFLLGRQYSSYWSLLNSLGPVPSLTGSTGAHPGDIDALDTSFRINNSAKYNTPDMGGYTASLQFGLGGAPGSLQSGSEFSAAMQYVKGPLGLGAGYLRMYNTSGSNGFNSETSSNIPVSTLNAGYITAREIQHLAVLSNYTFGPAVVGVSYTNVTYRPDGKSKFSGSAIFNTYGLVARYKVMRNAYVGAGYSFTAASRANGIQNAATYHQISMKQDYRFSKRTTVYFIQAWQRANGQTLDASGAGNIDPATATVGDSQNGSPSSTRNQFVAALGLAVAF